MPAAVVDHADRADAGGREVHARRRAQPARADAQRLGAEQLDLAGDTDLGEHGVARVAALLIGAQRDRLLPRQAGALPSGEPAGERAHVAVAELVEAARRERRARATRAVDDDRRLAIGHRALDALLEEAARDVHGAGDDALRRLVGLAHVDQRRARGAVKRCIQARRIDLGNLSADVAEQCVKGNHAR
jgi:hypothetical protein